MILHKTATTLSLYASRRLSRQRPTTILLLYALIALIVAFISYNVTFSLVLYPLATILFAVTSNTAAPFSPTSPDHPSVSTYAMGPIIPNRTAELSIRRTYLNYAALPLRRPEADLLLSYLKPTDTYLEFGSSGTTLTMPHFVQQAFSIEHDVHLCNAILSELRAHPQLIPKLRAFCVPVSAGHASWGLTSPFEEGSYNAFQTYVDLPRTNLSTLIFDKVLINGRARVACALRLLPHLSSHSLVFFHDFFLRPAHYAAVLPFYDEVARIVAHSPAYSYTDDPMGMLVLRPKPEYLAANVHIPAARIHAIYDAYVETPPSPATTGAEVAFENGLQRTSEGGILYYQLFRKRARESTLIRLLLDVIMLPFVILTYLVLRDIFRRLFLDALSSGTSNRTSRLLAGLAGDFQGAFSWRRPSQPMTGLPVVSPAAKAE